MAEKKLLIGRQEVIDLPAFGMFGVEAKIDTGAYTSSIHCSKLSVQVVDGTPILTFQLEGVARQFNTTEFEKKKIRSSNGSEQERYVISTEMVMFAKKFKAELSLTDRSKMKFPVLIGRKVLSGRFVVDVSEKNVSLKR